ncbi:MAG: T9SS type A sorting domain-containing protein [Bacteroidota bacterium]
MNGKHRPSDSLRTANMDFASEYQPGPLLEVFNTTTNDDTGPVSRAGDERYRLYKISRGDTTSTDYEEWPGDLGAPYIDVNENGKWDPGVDRPRFFGDQQIWAAINDVNNSLHAPLGATPPMGLEVQMLFYVLNTPHPLENTMFIHWKIINKSDADYDSVYLGIWIDVDLGDANDDLPGSDTTLALGYGYNGDNDDEYGHGYGSTPPAVGCTMLDGPIVPGGPGDSGRVGDVWRKGYRNLPPSSYIIFSDGVYSQLSFPWDGTPSYAPVARNAHEGKASQTGEHFRGVDSTIMPFWFDGDPVTGTGNLPSTFPLGPFRPQDVWMMLNAGPFTLTQGDTQGVAAAIVVSRGADRLESVTLLKQDVAWVRNFYESGGVVSVEDDHVGLPEKACLHQNYPNPFNPSTTLEFTIPRSSNVSLRIYNVLGEEVASLVEREMDAGVHRVLWDASGVASGVYLCRLSAGDFVQVRRMVIVR